MALTRDFKATVLARARRDPEFRLELLKEIIREAVKENPDIVDNAVKKLDKKLKRK
jgi:hypothetical protein